MSDQQRTQVYQNALAGAQSELDEMLGEFNALASRKDQLEHVMSMLTPLLDAVESQPASQAAAAQHDFAPLPARTFQPLAPHQAQPQNQVQFQERVQDRIQDQTQFQELAPAPVQNFAEATPVETSQAQVAFEEQPAAFAETSQPEPAFVLQRQETPKPQPTASNDRLEDRINFALNFALLS
jgi:hypothetical protein